MFGVKLAGQITNVPTFSEGRFLAGPTAEIKLPRGLSIEMDALYKRGGYSTTCCVNRQPGTQIVEKIDEKTRFWELPLMLKWQLPLRRIPVFGSAGFSARNVSGTDHDYGTSTFLGLPSASMSIDSRGPATDILNPWTYGPVVGAGVDLRAWKLHFQPELPYTRWNDSPFYYFTKPDSLAALLGIVIAK
jgi:hypothetical protein